MQRRKQFNLWVLCLLVMAPLLGAGTSGTNEVDDGMDVCKVAPSRVRGPTRRGCRDLLGQDHRDRKAEDRDRA